MGRPDPGAVIRKLLSVGQLVGPLVGPVTWSVAGVARHFLTIEFLRGPAGQPSPLLPPECAVCDAGLVSASEKTWPFACKGGPPKLLAASPAELAAV